MIAIASSSFISISAADMLKVVPLYGPSMRDSINIMAENQRLIGAAIRQKEYEEMSRHMTQLQGEQESARELERQLNEAKVMLSYSFVL